MKWTKADRQRASKMGWYFNESKQRIERHQTTFSNDHEAAQWVMEHCDSYYSADTEYKTCRKAVLLCCLGGTQ